MIALFFVLVLAVLEVSSALDKIPSVGSFNQSSIKVKPVVGCGGSSTIVQTIGTCQFSIYSDVSCSGMDAYASVTVTELGSGVTVDGCAIGQCSMKCGSESECTTDCTTMANNLIAYMYEVSLGETISQVQGGVCSCEQESVVWGDQKFETGICLQFLSAADMVASPPVVHFKAYAQGDASLYNIGYTYNFGCDQFANETDCATAAATDVIKKASVAETTMSGLGGWYVTSTNYPYTSQRPNLFVGGVRFYCPYGSTSYEIAYFNDPNDVGATMFLCTVDGVSSDPTAGFGGMFYTSSGGNQVSPWSGTVACNSGFIKADEEVMYFEIGDWDDDLDGGCGGKGDDGEDFFYDDDDCVNDDKWNPVEEDDDTGAFYMDDDQSWIPDPFDDTIDQTDDHLPGVPTPAPTLPVPTPAPTIPAPAYDDDSARRLKTKTKTRAKTRAKSKVTPLEQEGLGGGRSAELHVCLGETPAGLIGGGFQTCDPNYFCNAVNIFTGDYTCPAGYTAVDVLDANCPYAVSPDVNIANANGKLRGADKDNLKEPSTPHTSSVMYFCVLSSIVDPLLPPA